MLANITQRSVAGGRTQWERGVFNGIEFQFEKMKVLKMDGIDGCTTMWIYFMPQIVYLKMAKMVNFMLCIFYHNFLKSTCKDSLMRRRRVVWRVRGT